MEGRRRPWWRSTKVVLAASVLFAAGAVAVGSTFALFSAETENQASTVANGWIGAASGLSVTPSGYDAQLAWTPGTHGPVTGQQLLLKDNGSSSTCPASGYSSVANMASASTSSYTASNPASTTLAANIEAPNILNANINNTVTSIAMKNNASFAFVTSFTIQIDSEQMTVTNESGAGNKTWTVTRGVNGTTAAAHSSGAAVTQISVSVANATGFPQSGSFTILVNSEQMTVSSGWGTGAQTYVVSRGANGTTATSHASGALVLQTSDPVDGHYYCYEMVSTSASNWTATASFPSTQMGLVMTGIAINASVTANGKVTTGDVVTVTFNQAFTGISTITNTAVTCEKWTATGALTIYLDDVAYTNATCNTASPAYLVEITGLNNGQTSASFSIAAKATITLPSSTTATWTYTANGPNQTLTGTAVGAPSTAIVSSAVTDQAPACTDATYNCTPTATGNGF